MSLLHLSQLFGESGELSLVSIQSIENPVDSSLQVVTLRLSLQLGLELIGLSLSLQQRLSCLLNFTEKVSDLPHFVKKFLQLYFPLGDIQSLGGGGEF